MIRSPEPVAPPERPALATRQVAAAVLAPTGLWSRLEVVDRTGSTNEDLLAAGAEEGAILLAEEQSAGRGRLRRQWSSPPRAGLTFSVALRPGAAVPPGRWGWLPLLTGVAVHRALAGFLPAGAAGARLKWPNDVLVGVAGRKIAGILVQLSGDLAVVGVGLNVTTTPAELPGPAATSLLIERPGGDPPPPPPSREAVLVAVLAELQHWYSRWRGAAGDPVASGVDAAYRDACATLGAAVRLLLPHGEELSVTATGVDEQGRLLVADGAAGAGVRAVAAADVEHLR